MSSEADNPQAAIARAAELDADGHVALSVPCAKCAYNLRTLAHDARCPECGTPVDYSLHGHFLRFAQPAYVSRLARGGRLVLIAIGVFIAGSLLATIVGALLSMTTSSGMPGRETVMIPTVLGALPELAAAILLCIGLLQLTAADPNPHPARRGEQRVCAMLRVCAWAIPAAAVIDTTQQFIMVATVDPSDTDQVLTLLTGGSIWLSGACQIIGMATLGIITPLALLYYVGRLMSRIPRPGLVRFARILFWGLAIALPPTTLGTALVFAEIMPWMQTLADSGALLQNTSGGSAGTVRTSAPFGRVTYNVSTSAPATSTQPTTATTTSPTTAPTTARRPTPPRGVFVGLSFAMVGMCPTALMSVAALILLLLAEHALVIAAKDAAEHTRKAAATSQATGEQTQP